MKYSFGPRSEDFSVIAYYNLTYMRACMSLCFRRKALNNFNNLEEVGEEMVRFRARCVSERTPALERLKKLDGYILRVSLLVCLSIRVCIFLFLFLYVEVAYILYLILINVERYSAHRGRAGGDFFIICLPGARTLRSWPYLEAKVDVVALSKHQFGAQQLRIYINTIYNMNGFR